MGFESPHSFKEIHEIQPALKYIIKKVIEDFEQDERYWGNLEYQGPTALRYENMDINKLFQLHLTVGDLRNKISRIKRDFISSLDEKTKSILDEIESRTNAIIKSELEVELMKEWEERGQDNNVKVNLDLANILGNQIHSLEDSINKLRNCT